MANDELPKGFEWEDLQLSTSMACEGIVRSDSFSSLVDTLKNDSTLRSVSMVSSIGPEIYNCTIRKPTNEDYYSIYIECRKGKTPVNSLGRIER